MALNSSGPLSLGGSTVGQSINLELSQAATATISLNDTNARALAGVPSGQISIFNFYGKSSETYFMGSCNQFRFTGIGQDNVGNTIVLGQYTNNYGIFCKVSATGSVTLTTVGNSGSTIAGYSPGYNSSTSQINATAGYYQLKYSTSGVMTQYYDFTGAIKETVWQKIDSSGNIYYCGKIVFNPVCCYYPYYAYTTKINNAGTAQWTSYTTINYTNYIWARGIALNSTETSVFTSGGGSDSNQSTRGMALYSFSASTGALNWGYIWRSSSSTAASYDCDGWGVALDSSNNIYAVGHNPTTNTGYVYKTDSTGTLQWVRALTASGANGFQMYSVATDSSGNVYALGVATYTSVRGDLCILKYNSSGTLQWQRRLTANSYGWEMEYCADALKITSTGAILVGGLWGAISSAKSQAFFAKLPNDGSKTGTYTTIIPGLSYTTGVLTDAAGSIVRTSLLWTQNGSNGSSTTRSTSTTSVTLTYNTVTL